MFSDFFLTFLNTLKQQQLSTLSAYIYINILYLFIYYFIFAIELHIQNI